MDAIGSFFNFLFTGVYALFVLGIILIIVSLLFGGLYEWVMKQKFRIIKLSLFSILVVAIFINNYYVGGFKDEGLESLCYRNTSSNSFLLSTEFRKCILDEKYRNKLIQKNIDKWTETSNKIRDKWLSQFAKYNQKFIGQVQYIGYDKFITLNKKLPGILDFEYVRMPPLVKVTLSNCSYDFGEGRFEFYCQKQLLDNNTEKDGFWIIDASKFPELDFLEFSLDETYSFYLSTFNPSNESNIFFEHILLGVEITKEHINRNTDLNIKRRDRYFNGMESIL